MSNLNKFLPKKKEKVALIQAHIEKTLADELRVELKARGLTWSQFVTAAARALLDQSSGERKKS